MNTETRHQQLLYLFQRAECIFLCEMGAVMIFFIKLQ